VVPVQLLVRSPEGCNNQTRLLHGTSIIDVQLRIPPKNVLEVVKGLNIYSLSSALVNIGQDSFTRNPLDVRTCLHSVKDASELLSILLAGGHTVKAGLLAGAFGNIGKDKIADDIINTMKSAGYNVRRTDPFNDKLPSELNLRENPHMPTESD